MGVMLNRSGLKNLGPEKLGPERLGPERQAIAIVIELIRHYLRKNNLSSKLTCLC